MMFNLFHRIPKEITEAEARRREQYAKEQAARPKSKVEVLARAYCEELGYDPDAPWYPAPMTMPCPLWSKYKPKAEAALHDAAMAAAMRKLEAAE